MFDGAPQSPRQFILAAYPRSGTAMVRMALHYCYGQATGSVYPETDVSDFYRRTVNHAEHHASGAIKTHEYPQQTVGQPCVILVRDPRNVFRSLQTFYRVQNKVTYSIEQLIAGEHPWGDWSTWVRCWAVFAPRDAMWLRYEHFRPSMLRALGLGQVEDDTAMPDIDTLRLNDPSMFNSGSINGRGRFTASQERLLWQHHGSVMTMLGYERA